MKRLLIVLAACGSGTPPLVPTPPPPPPVVTAPPPPTIAAPISRPDSEIELVAVTFDGTAAVTTGTTGDARLWPALDGTLEPRVLDLPPTQAIAVATDPRGVAIADVDTAGGLVMRVVDKMGATLASATFTNEIAFTDVLATPHGFLVARADQSVALVSNDGVLGPPLVAESGQRIAGFAVAATAGIALVELDSDTGRGLRWLTLSPLAWGAWVPTKISPEGVLALSPSAAQIAMIVGSDRFRTTVVLDAKTGDMVATTEENREGVDDVVFSTETDVFSGYATTRHISQMTVKGVPNHPRDQPLPSRRQVHRVAAAGGRAFVGQQFALQIESGRDRSYVGYAMTDFDEIVSAQDRVMVRTKDSFVEVGSDLIERAHLAFTDANGVEYAGGTQWLVGTMDQMTGVATVRLVDTKSSVDKLVVQGATGRFLFDPGSRLFSTNTNNSLLGRLDEDGVIHPLTGLKTRSSQTLIVPLDKTRAGGVSALVITHDAGERIRWVTDPADLTKGATVQLLDGNPEAYDETGNVYVVTRAGLKTNLSVYKNGVVGLQTIGEDLGPHVFARGDGKRIGRVGNSSFAVTDETGRVLFTVPHEGFVQIAWLADGTLIAGSRTGLATYNADTGERVALRCGLSFGVHLAPPDLTAVMPAMCSVP